MRRSLLLLSLLLITSCAPSRGVADSKLAEACTAAVKATFTDQKENITLKDATYAFRKSFDGTKLREVTLKADYSYNGSAPDTKTYICNYTEEWSLFSWLPEFYNLQKDNDKFGNFNGSIEGDPAIIANISDASEKVLH